MTTMSEYLVNSAILADAAAGRFARWGRSTTIDEHTGEPVLPTATVSELHALAGIDTDGIVGNAALVHVYGYLLSTVETPYGPKHARWTEGGVARALGLAPSMLLPEPARDERGCTPLATLTPIVERLLAAPPAGAIVVEETGPDVVARTVLLEGRQGGGEDIALTVYGVGLGDRVLPVTVFPIADAAGTLASIEAEPPRLRYNAVDAAGRDRTSLDARLVRRGWLA